MKNRWIAALLAAALTTTFALAQDKPKPPAVPLDDADIPKEPDSASLGKNLARTMALLKASEQGKIQPIRILFYGQSIAAQGELQNALVNELRRQYPKANIISSSNAIGGYTSPFLSRVMVHDIVHARPDLIVFDDYYSGEKDGTYEQIIRYLRSRTTAEVLKWSPHVDNYGDVVDANREKEAAYRKKIADKYNCEFADVRGVWKQYLEQHKLPRTALLRDSIHNTSGGCELIAKILARHFVPNESAKPSGAVTTISLADASAWEAGGVKVIGAWKKSADGQGIELTGSDSRIELSFTGTRVDAVGAPEAGAASATILIDGKAPSAWANLWAASRPSRGPDTWFPGVNRVTLGSTPAQVENWTLHFYDIAPDASSYKYKLTGSVTGPDGEGASGTDFVSDSKRITIQASDFNFGYIRKVFKKDLPKEYDVKWKTFALCPDQYERQPGDAKPSDAKPGDAKTNDTKTNGAWQTVVNGLANQEHHLVIHNDGKGTLSLRALVVHRPEFTDTDTGPASK